MGDLKRFAAIFVAVLAVQSLGFGQNTGGLGGGFGGGTGAGGNGGLNQNSAGIRIDAQGVVSLIATADASGPSDKKRREAVSQKNSSQDFRRRSKQRCLSVVEFERELIRRFGNGQAMTEDQFYLAGLQRIDHLFVVPDQSDLIIAGPAEGFVSDSVGRMVGVESGRPTLRLDDLIVALRTVEQSQILGCSIDPDPQRLADLRKFIRPAEPASIEEVEARFNQMDDILGLQDVRIDGVPADSHFATILVEADYRMKCIAAGLEASRVNGLKSHLALMSAKGQPMQRWWFVPSYESISRSDDGLAYQLVGQRALLLTEEEIVDANGNRTSSPVTRKSNQAFAKLFTEKFPILADRNPVFGELQNLIDWAIVAALLTKERIAERIDWKKELFLDNSRLKYPVFDVPQKVPSQVSYKHAGTSIVGLVSGGVVINPRQTVDRAVAASRNSTKIDEVRGNATKAARSESHRWWWDAN